MTKYIIISGVDGSGKTTVIEGVRAQLEAEGKTVGYIWMRYHHKLVRTASNMRSTPTASTSAVNSGASNDTCTWL
jgi:thymidylate kinase